MSEDVKFTVEAECEHTWVTCDETVCDYCVFASGDNFECHADSDIRLSGSVEFCKRCGKVKNDV